MGLGGKVRLDGGKDRLERKSDCSVSQTAGNQTGGTFRLEGKPDWRESDLRERQTGQSQTEEIVRLEGSQTVRLEAVEVRLEEKSNWRHPA